MATKALPEARNERLRELVRQLLADIGGNQSDLARAMKLQPGQISELLSGRKGAGPSLLTAIAAYTGKSLDELMTGVAPSGGQLDLPISTSSPEGRARAAAAVLGFHPESVERGLGEAAADDTAWDLLTRIQRAESKRPPGDTFGSPTTKTYAANASTLSGTQRKQPADAPPVEAAPAAKKATK